MSILDDTEIREVVTLENLERGDTVWLENCDPGTRKKRPQFDAWITSNAGDDNVYWDVFERDMALFGALSLDPEDGSLTLHLENGEHFLVRLIGKDTR